MDKSAGTNIVAEEIMIASDTPGIELFVRNKRRADLANFSFREDDPVRRRIDLSRFDFLRSCAGGDVVDGSSRQRRL